MTKLTLKKKEEDLFETMISLIDKQSLARFCYDLMTPQEIEAFADRWEVAKQLAAGKSQREVSAETKVSIATVTRVNKFLTRGYNGYKNAMNSTKHHTPINRLEYPVR